MLDNNDKKELIENTAFVQNIKNEKQLNKLNKSKRFCFVLSVIVSLLLIGLVYYLSDYSNIYSISVEGNIYLKDDDIIKYSGLTNNDKFLLVNSHKIAKRILNTSNIISECNIEKIDGRLIKINVKENKMIAYTFEEDKCVIILDKNKREVVNNDNLYLINSIPLIEGFSNDDLLLLLKNFNNVDYKMIDEISEIHYFKDLKYQNVQLIMRDGNNIFTSVYGLNLLNSYYAIEASYDSDDNYCVYFEDISQNAYVSACPWVEIETVDNDLEDVAE